MLFARLKAQDAAEAGATAAAARYRDTRSLESAREAAGDEVDRRDRDAEVRGFEVHPDGTVRVVVVKRAPTLLIKYIGFLKGFTRARGSAEGRPPEL